MTKNHFIAIAAEIKSKYRLERDWSKINFTVQCAALDAVAVVCKVAADANPRFDERRFRAACGVPTV